MNKNLSFFRAVSCNEGCGSPVQTMQDLLTKIATDVTMGMGKK
jgi:hypothetical protein